MVTASQVKDLSGDTNGKGDHKSNLIRLFIDSQRRHATAYAAEGKKDFSRWIRDCGDEDGKPAKQSATIEIFSSPVLKPRNANCPSVIEKSTQPASEEKHSSRKERERDTSARVSARKDKSSEAATKPKKKPVPPQVKADSGKDKARSTPKSTRKKRKRSVSDIEREELLAQRRERRRRKKEIVDPKTHDELSSLSEGEHNEINLRNPKTKNGKKSKLPAGLALMHGFSAENIGKRRLTAPMTTSGVFNKGRASSKAKVERKKTVKSSCIFNELDFLNRASSKNKEQTSRKAYEKRVGPCNNVTSTSSRRSQKRCGEDDSSAIDPSHSFAPSRKSTLSRSSIGTKSEYASQVWEIEKEFLQDDAGSGKTPTHEKPGSLVINSREWDWCVSEALGNENKPPSKPPATAQEQTDPSIIRNSSARSASTISPSQSASQVAERTPHSPDLRTTSKFFAHPEQGVAIPDGSVPEKSTTLENQDTPAKHVDAPGTKLEQNAVNPPSRTIPGPELVCDREEVPSLRGTEVPGTRSTQTHEFEMTMDALEAEVLSALGIHPVHSGPDPKTAPFEEEIHIRPFTHGPQLVLNSRQHVPFQQDHRGYSMIDIMDNWSEEDTRALDISKADDTQDTYSQSPRNCAFEAYSDRLFHVPEGKHDDDLDGSCNLDYFVSDCLRDAELDQASSVNRFDEHHFYVYSEGETPHDLNHYAFHPYDTDADLLDEPSVLSGAYDLSDDQVRESEPNLNQVDEDNFLDESIDGNSASAFSEDRELIENARTSEHLFALTAISKPVGTLREAEEAVAKEFQKKFYPIKF